MVITARIEQAIRLASKLHRDQVRNDEERTPYVTHLFSVFLILSQVTDDEDILIAGLMHDSLEDVPHYTYDRLVSDCGERVADIVLHVTEPLDASKEMSEQLPWLVRKEKYLERLRQGSVESALVSCADKIHNTESFLLDFKGEGVTFVSRFGSSIKNRVWFHEQVLMIVTEKLGSEHALVLRLASLTERFKQSSL